MSGGYGHIGATLHALGVRGSATFSEYYFITLSTTAQHPKDSFKYYQCIRKSAMM